MGSCVDVVLECEPVASSEDLEKTYRYKKDIDINVIRRGHWYDQG